MRVAVCWAPPAADPLWALGSAWLGRDAESGLAISQPDIPNLAALTESPCRYGFHATLKAPIILAGTFDAFLADARALARTLKPARLPPLAVRALDGFAALCPATEVPDLAVLAASVVTELDHHRRPEEPEKRARRGLGAGWWEGSSRGSAGTEGSRGTSKRPSLPPRHSSTPPPRFSRSAASHVAKQIRKRCFEPRRNDQSCHSETANQASQGFLIRHFPPSNSKGNRPSVPKYSSKASLTPCQCFSG
jgi:Protein of unknown function (DUF1045)